RHLACGSDIEFGYLMGRAGYDRVYWPALRVHHHLPASRLETRYFCRLIVGVVRSQLTLEAKYLHRPGPWARPFGLARLAAAALAVPALLLRPDGLNEVFFVLAGRWAMFLGPYPLELG